jgi:hypothetical protein
MRCCKIRVWRLRGLELVVVRAEPDGKPPSRSRIRSWPSSDRPGVRRDPRRISDGGPRFGLDIGRSRNVMVSHCHPGLPDGLRSRMPRRYVSVRARATRWPCARNQSETTHAHMLSDGSRQTRDPLGSRSGPCDLRALCPALHVHVSDRARYDGGTSRMVPRAWSASPCDRGRGE